MNSYPGISTGIHFIRGKWKWQRINRQRVKMLFLFFARKTIDSYGAWFFAISMDTYNELGEYHY